MIHPCAACHLRFATTGELRDHVASEHTEHAPVATPPAPARHPALSFDSYSRSGWALPDPPADAGRGAGPASGAQA